MTKESVNIDFRLIDEMRNYLLEEIKENELMSEEHQNVCRVLKYISPVSGCASISAFALLVENTVGITSSEIGLKICAITAAVKKYKLLTEKKRKKHDHISLLAKTKINTIETLVSKALSDSYINHEQFVSVNKKMKEEIKIFSKRFGIYWIKTMETYCVNCKKTHF